MVDVTRTRASRQLPLALISVLFAAFAFGSPVAAQIDPGGEATGEEMPTVGPSWTENSPVTATLLPPTTAAPRVEPPPVATTRPPLGLAPPGRIEPAPVSTTTPEPDGQGSPQAPRNQTATTGAPPETAPATAAVALEPAASDEDSGTGPLVIGVVLVAVLIGGAVALWQWARRSAPG